MHISLSRAIPERFTAQLALIFILLLFASSSHAVTFNNWSSSGPSGTHVRSIIITPTTIPTIYVGTNGSGVYKRSTGSPVLKNWSSVSVGISNRKITSLASDPATPATIYAGTAGNGLYKSTTSATSWSATGWTSDTINSIAITTGYIYAATSSNGVQSSSDSGATWTARNSGLTNSNVTSIMASPNFASDQTLYAGTSGGGTNGGIFKSTNAGSSWSQANGGLTNLNITSIAINNSGRLFAGTASSGVFTSNDDAVSWTQVITGLTDLHVNFVSVSTSGELFAATDTGIFFSADNGTNWNPATTAPSVGYITAIAANPLTSSSVYAATGGGIFFSTDSGVTWNELNPGLKSIDIQSIAFNPNSGMLSQVFAGSNGGGVYLSNDGGINWSHKNSGIGNSFIQAVAIDRDSTPTLATARLFAGTKNGIYRSTNSGSSWTASVSQPSFTDIRAFAIDTTLSPATTLYAGSYGGGVYKSTDSGVNWVSTVSLADQNVTSLAIDMNASPVTLYAGTAGGGVFKSSNGGTSWSLAATGNSGLISTVITALAVTPTHLYASTPAGIHSLDTVSGTQWNARNTGLTSLDTISLSTNPSNPAYIAAGTRSAGVFTSTDRGANWKAANNRLRDLGVQALAIDGATPAHIAAGTPGNGVAVMPISATITVSPASPFSYGKANALSTPSSQLLTIGNTGIVDLAVSGITTSVFASDSTVLTPAGNGISQDVSSTCLSVTPTLIPNANCTLLFKFTPGAPTSSATISNHATISFASNDSATPSKDLQIDWIAGKPPVVAFSSPPAPSSTVRNPVTLTGTAVTNLGTLTALQLSFDNGTSWGTATTSLTSAYHYNWSYSWATAPAAGNSSYTILARGTDSNAFTTTSYGTLDLTLDNTVPDTTIDTKPSSPSGTVSPTFTFSSSKPGASASFECKLDTGSYSTCTSPFTPTLTNGSHTFTVRAYDGVYPLPGNVDPSPATYTWTVDTVPPVTTITPSSKPSNPTNITSATFIFTSSKTGSSFVCSLDGTSASCTSPITYSSLSDASHTFTVRATDSLGNVETTAQSYTWVVDTVAPDITINTKPAALNNNTTATFTFSSSDTTATFECKIDSAAAYSACSSPKLYPGLTAATHTFYVRATDPAGNTGTPTTYSWTIDTTPPQTSISTHPASRTNSTSATFTFSCDKPNGATYACNIDGGAFADCTTNTQALYTGLAAGLHTFTVKATDALGNVDLTPDSYSWTIDLTLPDTAITSKPANLTNQTSATFAFTSTKSPATFECSIDGASYITCTTPKNYTTPADGSHTFNVRATDDVGNVDSTPASFTWVVDTVPPDVTIATKPAALTNNTTATFTFSSTDTSATFECKIDSGAYSACSSGQAYTTLASTSHTFNVRSTDPAGNTGTAAAYSWTIDTTTPHTTINTNPANPTNSTSATFTFSCDKPNGATYACSLDNGTFADCTTNTQALYTGLAAGSHTFTVKATDALGNVEAAPTPFNWTIDRTPPVTSITQRPANPANLTTAIFSFTSSKAGSTFQCSIDGALSTCTSPTTYSSLANTSHTFTIQATDLLGNIETSMQTYSWVVDTLPPDVAIGSKPATLTNSVSANFTFTSTDTTATFECSMDSATSYTACSSPLSYSGLASASHTFYVRSKDPAGNFSTPATFSWIIDTTPPNLSITSKPLNMTGLTTAVFAFSSTTTGVTFSCSIDGGTAASCATGQTYSGLTAGSHTFAVTATNPLTTTFTQSYTWTIDLTPPTTSIIASPLNPTNSTTAVFSFSSYKPSGSSFECSIDNGAFTACTAPKTYSGLIAGNHLFSVRATDAAGNRDNSPPAYNWLIDNLIPGVSSSFPLNNSSKISVSGTKLTFVFSKPMLPTSVTTSTIQLYNSTASKPVPATVTYDIASQSATLTPTMNMPYTSKLVATVNGVTDLAGNQLNQPFTLTFRTDPDGDLNMDGKVDVTDAILALQTAIGRYKPSAEEIVHGDVAPLKGGKPSPDGTIDGRDAIVILGRILGIHNW